MVVTVAHEGHSGPSSSVTLRPTYSVMLIAWLLLPTTVVVFLVVLGIERSRHEFDDHVGQIYAQLTARLQSNESVLNGFASFLAVAGNENREAIAHYATPLLQQHPHIYSLDVVDEVAAGQRDEFLSRMRSAGYPSIAIRRFDYAGSRRWQAAALREYYYPLGMVVSLHEGLDELLGMDVSQVQLLNKPLQMSLQKSGPFASRPFELYHGSTGYAMFRGVEPVIISGNDVSARCLALLVVRVSDLLPAESLPSKYNFHVTITVRNNGAESQMTLLDLPSHPEGWLVKKLLPTLSYTNEIEGSTPRVSLTVERQLRWEDINLPIIVWVIVVAAITFALLQLYARAHWRSEIRRLELEDLLRFRAHHDGLTGLPNRTLIIDRIEQGIRHAQREGQSLAVLFLDLDGFKPVNDTYGHEAGDDVLREVANRLRMLVRDRDTVGRMGGDEFIVILASTDHNGANVVSDKVDELFKTPFVLASGQEVLLGISVGIAIYPVDGITTGELLRIADANMYHHKVHH